MVCCQQEPAGWMSYLEGSSISTCVATNHNHYCQVYTFLFYCFGLFWPIFATVGRFAWGRVSLFSRIYLSPDRGELLRKCANNLIRILNPVKVCVLFKYFPWTVTQAVCAALTLMFVPMIIFLVFQISDPGVQTMWPEQCGRYEYDLSSPGGLRTDTSQGTCLQANPSPCRLVVT